MAKRKIEMGGMEPAQVALALALADTIKRFTTAQSMTSEDVIRALAFITGSACGQPLAHAQYGTKQLRDMAISDIDKGIDSARGQYGGPKLIGLH